MVKRGLMAAVIGVLLGTAMPGWAQTTEEQAVSSGDVIPLPTDNPDQLAELQRWVEEFSEWRKWSDAWRNRTQPGWFSKYRDRAPKPEPPTWLATTCATVFEATDLLTNACEMLQAWRADDAAAEPIRKARAVAVAQHEHPTKTTWWQQVHLDVMWPAMQWQSSIYGVAGMHIATEVGGRLQIFKAPGAMLLTVPGRRGSRVWKVAVNYGIGYRVTDFTFPGGRPASLHINLAKMWMVSDVADAATSRTTDVIGFSVTFKDH